MGKEAIISNANCVLIKSSYSLGIHKSVMVYDSCCVYCTLSKGYLSSAPREQITIALIQSV